MERWTRPSGKPQGLAYSQKVMQHGPKQAGGRCPVQGQRALGGRAFGDKQVTESWHHDRERDGQGQVCFSWEMWGSGAEGGGVTGQSRKERLRTSEAGSRWKIRGDSIEAGDATKSFKTLECLS